jgi:elongation factor G
VAIALNRNIGLLAHADAGKTTLMERLRACAGASCAEVAASAADDADEVLSMALGSVATTIQHGQHQVTLVDAPGRAGAAVDVERVMTAVDGAVALLCAVNGVEPSTETLWRASERYGLPRLVLVNKIDKPGADFAAVVEHVRLRLNATPLALDLPCFADGRFAGVVDLVGMQAWLPGPNGSVPAPIPAEWAEAARAGHDALLDTLVEFDDAIGDLVLAGESIPVEVLSAAIRRATLANCVVPVVAASAFQNVGVRRFLDAAVAFLPSPEDRAAMSGRDPVSRDSSLRREASETEPFAALSFRVVNVPGRGPLHLVRVFSGALPLPAAVFNAREGVAETVAGALRVVGPRALKEEFIRAGQVVALEGLRLAVAGDSLSDAAHPVELDCLEFAEAVLTVGVEVSSVTQRASLEPVLRRLEADDPSFRARLSGSAPKASLYGTSEAHLEAVLDRLHREFSLDVVAGRPEVAFKETFQRAAVGAHEHPAPYAMVKLEVEPAEQGAGFGFEDCTPHGRLPEALVRAVGAGVREKVQAGARFGYPAADVTVRLVDAAWREGESSELAFKAAAVHALENAARVAGTVLLEPVMAVEVVFEESALGAILADLTGRRGTVKRIESRGSVRVVAFQAPLSELFGYAATLRSIAGVRASFTMAFAYHERVPLELADMLEAAN